MATLVYPRKSGKFVHTFLSVLGIQWPDAVTEAMGAANDNTMTTVVYKDRDVYNVVHADPHPAPAALDNVLTIQENPDEKNGSVTFSGTPAALKMVQTIIQL